MRRWLLLAMVMLGIAALPVGAEPPPRRPVWITLSLEDSASQPIPDARVTIAGRPVPFDAESCGCYQLRTTAPVGARWRIQVRHRDYLPAHFDLDIAADRENYAFHHMVLGRAGEPYVIEHGRRVAFLEARGVYLVIPRHPPGGDYTAVQGLATQLAARYGLDDLQPGGRCVSAESIECVHRELLFREREPLTHARRAQFLGEVRAHPLVMMAGPLVTRHRNLQPPRFVLSHRIALIFEPHVAHDEAFAFLERRALHVEHMGMDAGRWYATVLLPLGVGMNAVAAAEELQRAAEVQTASNVLDVPITP